MYQALWFWMKVYSGFRGSSKSWMCNNFIVLSYKLLVINELGVIDWLCLVLVSVRVSALQWWGLTNVCTCVKRTELSQDVVSGSCGFVQTNSYLSWHLSSMWEHSFFRLKQLSNAKYQLGHGQLCSSFSAKKETFWGWQIKVLLSHQCAHLARQVTSGFDLMLTFLDSKCIWHKKKLQN